MKKLLFIVLLFPFLIACNDDDLNDNQKEQLLDIATVDNPDQKTDFYFSLTKKFTKIRCQSKFFINRFSKFPIILKY